MFALVFHRTSLLPHFQSCLVTDPTPHMPHPHPHSTHASTHATPTPPHVPVFTQFDTRKKKQQPQHRYIDVQKQMQLLDSHIYNNNIIQGRPIFSYVSSKHFWYNKMNKYGVLRVRKSRHHGIWKCVFSQ